MTERALGAHPRTANDMASMPAVDARSATPARPVVGDWSRFYDEHFDFVWRSLRRLGVPFALLDDAAQEVFVIAFRREREFEGRSSFRTWLFGIAYNRARDIQRGARRRPEEPLPEEPLPASGPDQEATAMRAEAVRLVYRVLDELTPDRRAVLVMAEVEDMTAAEMAELLAIPLNTVYSRVRLARRDFEAALKRVRAQGRRT